MIDQIEKPKIERVEIGDNNRYGKFVVNPLERGFGQTLGNSLRRVLLNSLPGVAATSVRIEGVQHEFSTVPGVKEDVAELILNVKLLSAKLYTDLPKILTIDAVGPCEVKAGDIRIDDEVEIINPDLHIATLSEGAHLQMQITLEKGRGYVSAERNKQLAMERNKVGGMPIGVIPVDSIFTPIRKVSYAVEDTRVGQVTDYDKLTIEVWTNGTILPKEALASAAQIITNNMRLFIDLTVNVVRVDYNEPEDNSKEKVLEMDHRGTRPLRARLQLPEARGHQHRGRARPAQPGGHDEGAQPGQEVPRGSRAEAHRTGAGPQVLGRITHFQGRNPLWPIASWPADRSAHGASAQPGDQPDLVWPHRDHADARQGSALAGGAPHHRRPAPVRQYH